MALLPHQPEPDETQAAIMRAHRRLQRKMRCYLLGTVWAMTIIIGGAATSVWAYLLAIAYSRHDARSVAGFALGVAGAVATTMAALYWEYRYVREPHHDSGAQQQELLLPGQDPQTCR